MSRSYSKPFFSVTSREKQSPKHNRLPKVTSFSCYSKDTQIQRKGLITIQCFYSNIIEVELDVDQTQGF